MLRAGVNILPLFRYFRCGTVLDFWHFSEKFFGRSDIIISPKNEKLFQKLVFENKFRALHNYTSSFETEHFHVEFVI